MDTPMIAESAGVLKTCYPHFGPAKFERIIPKSPVPYHTQVLKLGAKQKVNSATCRKRELSASYKP